MTKKIIAFLICLIPLCGLCQMQKSTGDSEIQYVLIIMKNASNIIGSIANDCHKLKAVDVEIIDSKAGFPNGKVDNDLTMIKLSFLKSDMPASDKIKNHLSRFKEVVKIMFVEN